MPPPDFKTLTGKLGTIPYMTVEQAKTVTTFIKSNDIHNILELGFFHGVSTCYMAGALAQLGGDRKVTAIDLESARTRSPNIETLLSSLSLSEYAVLYYEPTSYIWRLMKMLDEDPNPRFDFCFIDGAHTWYVDGFAFFLVDKLLKPGGWILFDDLNWNYAEHLTGEIGQMPEDEKTTHQVRKIFELLVKPHPSYDLFREDEGWGWGWAHKSVNCSTEAAVIKKEVVHTVGLMRILGWCVRKARRIASGRTPFE